jgi:steroid Delta-isomerase
MPLTRPAWPVAALLALFLAGCGGPGAQTAAELNESYERALARTAPSAVELPGGEAGEKAALARAEGFFGDMGAAAIRARAAETYAPDAYLNDNLVALEGAGPIGEYFSHTAGRVRALRVSFLDVVHAGPDYFVRWRMTVASDGLNDGAPMVSYGMTHFRFDASGRILLHKDFWDAGTGLYEYLPGLGTVLRRLRAAAGAG